MATSPSLASRALLAIVLMIGFYLLALGIAFGLLWIPYAEWNYAGRLHIKLAIVCVAGGLMILWSILPRIDRFTAPGPQLTQDKHPRLFAELNSVAQTVNQSMPAEVYLVHDINAWVSQRGGLMGFGSRRVMGLGLPLMRVLTVSQLRAVLAHEFGHYHGGDVKLGPWIYKTRNAIIRTVQTLAGEGGGSWLQAPFVWYGKMFLRITHAVSRKQEFTADELAARAVGSRPLITGLQTVHAMGPAFPSFWVNEMVPVLSAGYRPSLVDGFERFVVATPIADAISKGLQEQIEHGKADPYDTHPPLKERIAAVEHLPAGGEGGDDPASITLLEDVPELERQILIAMAGENDVQKLKPVTWDDVGTQVYLPQWKGLVRGNIAGLKGITPESLPQLAADLKGFGNRFVKAVNKELSEEHPTPLATATVGAALTLLLQERGWTMYASPGAAIVLRHGESEIEAFAAMEALSSGKLTAETWQQRCTEAGIAGVDLSTVPT